MRVRTAFGLLAVFAGIGCTSESSTEQTAAHFESTLGSPVLTSNGAGASIQRPTSSTIPEGGTLALRALQESSGRRIMGGISWSTSNAGVAIVAPSTGVVSGVTPGKAAIRLSASGVVVDSLVVEVAAKGSFQISPTNIVLQARVSMQMWSTSTSSVVWTSANSAVASITPSGMLTSVAIGTTTVTATNAAGVTATAPVSIVPPPAWLTRFSLNPSTVTLGAGATQQFAIDFAWNDGNTTSPNVAYTATGGTITASGLFTAGSAGGTYMVIAAQQGGPWVDTSTVIVSAPFVVAPAAIALQTGATQQIYSTSQTPVVWSSANSAIATINQSGIVSAVAPGTTTLSARNSSGATAGATIVVSAPPAWLTSFSLTPAVVDLSVSATHQFAVSGVWSDGTTSTPSATYSATGGSISAAGLYTAGTTPGAFRVIAVHQGGTKADTSTVNIAAPVLTLLQLVLSPATATVTAGSQQQFVTAALWSNGNTALPGLTYSATGGTINAAGLYIAGSTPGVYRVIVSGGGKADTSAITVNASAPTLTSLTMTPPTATVITGATQQFATAALWSNGTTTLPALSYTATGGSISASGLYTAGSIPGVYSVIVSGGGKADTSAVTVNIPAPTLTSLTMTPGTLTINTGATQQFTTVAMWSNGTTTLPALTYVATGGTISASGLYTAGSTAGTYRVIVSGGGKADTTSVVVNVAPTLRTLLDREFYSKGQYGAFASPWSTYTDLSLRHNIDYSDSIVVDLNTFPASSLIKWHWPNRVSTTAGVWGYMMVWYGNYDGGEPYTRVPPKQVKNITTFREDFSLVQSGAGSYNTLNEFYLTSEAGNPAAKVIEIGYFLHGAAEGKNFRDSGRLIGSYTDASGRNWEARMQGTFCMLMLVGGGDLLSGTIDIKATLNFLTSKSVITGNEWFNGIALGVEPVKGSGELRVNQWVITYN